MAIALILRQSPKKSLKDFKRGLSQLTPKDHMRSKIVFHSWATFGATMASLSLLLRVFDTNNILSAGSTLGFGIFVAGMAGLQFVEWRKEKQKLTNLDNMTKLIKKNKSMEVLS